MPDFHITPLQHADLADVLSFLLAARRSMFPKLEGTPLPTDLAQLGSVYQRDSSCLLLARQAGKLIGSIGYLAYDGRFPGIAYPGSRAVEVVRLFVAPEHRRAGVARSLWLALLEHARASGQQVLYLHTHPFLTGAIEFWQRQGFQLVQVDPDPVWQTTHMQLRLAG
jgi:ribosomal protein S18 acetylase RimI-like enzyme